MQSNYKVARIFMEMAEGLELVEENPYRIHAYENAARTILDLNEPLEEIRRRGELLALPGVGESIAAKIEEILDTGHLKAHDEMLAKFPPSVMVMMRTPGIGPHTAERLFHELGIESLDELEKAALEGRIRHLRGFGEKSEANILRGIRLSRRQHDRIPLGQAYPLAREIIAELRKTAPVEEIEMAGSLRRMREDIGDIDILVTSPDPLAVMRAVERLPITRGVLMSGPTKTSILTEPGLQVDVRAVEPDDFGAALQYFTGSKAHNVKLRTIAVKRGFKISEYGIFRIDTGERIGGRTEEEIYRPLGMPLFPPELREDRGEIELALRGELPDFVTWDEIRGDLHTHTNWSDGRASIREMALAARERRYEYLAISDHSPARGIAHGLTPERLRNQIREIRAVNDELRGITLLAASEVDIRRDGSLDYPDDVLAELDLCIASVHSSFSLDKAEQTERLIKAIRNPYLDIIGHPTGRLVGARDPIDLDMRRVMEAAADAGVAMEINAQPDRLDLKDEHIREAREMGVALVIDSDAHSTEQLDLLHFGLATARRGWAVRADIMNTLPLKSLRAGLRRFRLRKAA